MPLDLTPAFASPQDASADASFGLDAALDAAFEDALFEDAAPRPGLVRLDRFTLPEASRAEFLRRVGFIHRLLRTRPGFLRDLAVERPLPDGRLALATLVEWETPEDAAAAAPVVKAALEGAGLDLHADLARLEVQGEKADWQAVELSAEPPAD
ncbi:hypothetical protein [Albimonas pacifica]|uniref:Antibiotic biosynthesis monooxygenase n=1 Tax=Albimonas pacifica TaxID=1114924 RepID=A0A1I3GN47_9RHOB|nr:hypothetical protein [Albimonas pacifica]SFI24836.1 hypothetical protein SAMN05216258_105250 [Albimonas pacifica]